MGLRGDSSSAESQAGDNVRSLLIVDRGFTEGGEVVWIDGSDFELELESVKAQLARLWPRQTNWRKVWFSRQACPGVSAFCLHSCKRPLELSIMLAPWIADIAPPLDSMPEGGPFYACSTGASLRILQSQLLEYRTMAREAC
jgi:hypothetical protein